MLDAFAQPQPAHDLGRVIRVTGRHQRGHVPSNHLRRRVAVDALRSLVPAMNDSVQVLAQNGVVGRLDNGRQLYPRLAGGGFPVWLPLPPGGSFLHARRGVAVSLAGPGFGSGESASRVLHGNGRSKRALAYTSLSVARFGRPVQLAPPFPASKLG